MRGLWDLPRMAAAAGDDWLSRSSWKLPATVAAPRRRLPATASTPPARPACSRRMQAAVTRIVELGKVLQSRIKEFFDAPIDAAATPLEIVRAVLDELELKVQPIGRGRRVFP